ncbi:tyrosine-protein kinase JAK3 [Python bivittatus]|uniref:Tyrosine-protein kinase n=1 Tax=Python bivittatus TaxID=176946 RepID=A0A9F5J5Z4_PYTBI|nr:tyrosine-protein kinase JAK3 [Python bivittatus]
MLPTSGETPLAGNVSHSSLSPSLSGVLQVYLYHLPNSPRMAPDTAGVLNFTRGEYTAEELCVAAARACGILPVCHSLFALAAEDLSRWFAPSHVFLVDKGFSQVVLYRIRFFFPDWFGPRKSHRLGLTDEQASPVLDCSTMDYLFAQSRSDFIGRQMAVPLTLETQEACLGLAVLDLLWISRERKQTPAEVTQTISYKSCLPEKLRCQLQAQNFVTRKRIRRQFARSLRQVSRLPAEVSFLKLKYLIELEGLGGGPAEEAFSARLPGQTAEGERWLWVSAEKGILWSSSRAEQDPHPFCDFCEVADVTIKQAIHNGLPVENRIVTITKTDCRALEVEFPHLKEALSFVSLLDGYYRLLVDSQHYFCKEVAPPRLLEDQAAQCHGPVTSEFAANKLKMLGSGGGAYLLRRSLVDFDSYLLTICVEAQTRKEFKSLLIQRNSDGTFSPAGIAKKFHSLQEVLGLYRRCSLQVEGVTIQLGTHCPPQPKEKSNLLIVRGGSCHQLPTSPSVLRRANNQMMFHKIQAEDLVQGENVGQGTFTRIYRGFKQEPQKEAGDAELGEAPATEVILKVLDSGHCHLAEEDRKIPHGNVSARKVLLAREGDEAAGHPPFIKLSDPGVSTAALSKEGVTDRIPWVAPECVEDPKKLAVESDRWGFGATLWEIFNGGHMPVWGMGPQAKLRFYQERRQLPTLKWTELAGLVAQCMDYCPPQRPPFRAIIRDLNSFITSDYELLTDLPASSSFGGGRDDLVGQDPTVFEDRHLKYISVLGKGNFGSVELCRYDPLGDSTGELVAVKQLQQTSPEQQQNFEHEIAILRSLTHDFIVACRGVAYSRGRNSLRLVMEYLPSGCLRGYLQKNQERLDLRKLLLYAWQVCKGMDYLGSRRYIHRDLATRNILVENENRVKIGDFGLAKILPQGKEYYVVREPGQSPIFWYAPESLADSVFSQESDVWSFGVVLYELFTYGSTSHSPSEEFLRMMGHSKPALIVCHLLELLKEQKRLPPPPGCPPEILAVMQACWSFLPSQRPRFCTLTTQVEALRHSHCKSRG